MVQADENPLKVKKRVIGKKVFFFFVSILWITPSEELVITTTLFSFLKLILRYMLVLLMFLPEMLLLNNLKN